MPTRAIAIRVDGAVLREVRTRAGLRQADVADILGVNRSTISNMEADRQAVSAEQVDALVRALPPWASAMLRGGEATTN